VGRGAHGNPFLFQRLNHFLSTSEKLEQKSKVTLFEEYLALARSYGIRESLIKKQSMQFAKGVKYAQALKGELKLLTDPDDIMNRMRTFVEPESRSD